MNTILRAFAAVMVSLLLTPLLASAVELSTGEKDTILIGELKIQPAVSERAIKRKQRTELQLVSDSLQSQLVSALNATRIFQLVEQERVTGSDPAPEPDLQAADVDDKKIAQAGKKAGARFAFLPQIDGFEDASEVVEYQATGRASVSRKLFLSAVVRIVETASGAMLPDSPSVQLTRTEEKDHVRPGALSVSDEVIVALAKEMAKKLSQEAVMLIRPAKVLTVTGKQVLINRGSEAGFTKGDLVEIYSVQSIKDEETGELFRNEVPVGQASISRIEKSQSYATISGDDAGITKGCIVRFIKTAARRAAEAEPPPDTSLPDFGTKGDTGVTPGSSEKPLKWK